MNSINYRKDYRTTEQFEQDIKYRTAKEKFLVELFRKECEYLGYTCSITNNGIDNTGKLVKKSDCKPDYKIVIDTGVTKYDWLCEVKNSPVATKWTFKVYHLQQYVKQGANILIFWNTGRIDKCPENIDRANTRWGVIECVSIEKMLDKYTPYKEYMFGNKLCIKVPAEDFSMWINVRKLHNA